MNSLNQIHKSLTEELIECFQRMDIKAISNLLDDTINFNGDSMNEFISDLREKFNLCKVSNDTFLEREDGFCKGCQYGTDGFSLFGKKSGKKWAFVVREENGKITFISDCNLFENITSTNVESK